MVEKGCPLGVAMVCSLKNARIRFEYLPVMVTKLGFLVSKTQFKSVDDENVQCCTYWTRLYFRIFVSLDS